MANCADAWRLDGVPEAIDLRRSRCQDARMGVRRVLVVGAGIAGSTVSYLLARNGVEVTVVERATGQRSSGSPVDVRGPALPVVEQMNVLPAIVRPRPARPGCAPSTTRATRSVGFLPRSAAGLSRSPAMNCAAFWPQPVATSLSSVTTKQFWT